MGTRTSIQFAIQLDLDIFITLHCLQICHFFSSLFLYCVLLFVFVYLGEIIFCLFLEFVFLFERTKYIAIHILLLFLYLCLMQFSLIFFIIIVLLSCFLFGSRYL